MRSLLDVNVLIALFDPDHVFHNRAHVWWNGQANGGWASCPITENGFVRIMSQAGYSVRARFTPNDLIHRLTSFATQTNHEFWPDSLTLRDDHVFVRDRIHGSRPITDLYLLALAARHQGRLATFDAGIPRSAVKDAQDEHLIVI